MNNIIPAKCIVIDSAFTPRSGTHVARPLSRAFGSPLVTLSPQGSPREPINIDKQMQDKTKPPVPPRGSTGSNRSSRSSLGEEGPIYQNRISVVPSYGPY